MNKKEKELRKNAHITNITEVIINQNRFGNRFDVSEYKWEITTNLENKPSHVIFSNEDYTEVLSVSLSTLFDRCLKEYKVHLEDEKEKVEEEKREEKRLEDKKLLHYQLDELIESYEMFIKQIIKDELHDRMTNEENEDFDEELKFILTNIRKMVDELSKNRNGKTYRIHYGDGNSRMNEISIQKEWYLENYDKLTQIILSVDPEHKPSSQKYSKNKYGTSFMCLSDWSTDTSYSVREKFYEKLYFLLRKMKKSKISYWYSK